MAAEPIGQVGHVVLPKPPKEGHSPTNPSNMQYELLINTTNTMMKLTSRRSIFFVSYHNGTGTASAWQAETKVITK